MYIIKGFIKQAKKYFSEMICLHLSRHAFPTFYEFIDDLGLTQLAAKNFLEAGFKLKDRLVIQAI